jgi:hypothetical protein
MAVGQLADYKRFVEATYIERKELQETYGGRTQGGIGPEKEPERLHFLRSGCRRAHRYFDGWREDSCFHYAGEGQYGDQQMKSGNAAILDHVQQERALRVFMGARGMVTYEDEFELDSAVGRDVAQVGTRLLGQQNGGPRLLL